MGMYIKIKNKRYYCKYLKPKKFQVATVREKERAKEIAKELAGLYGFPKY